MQITNIEFSLGNKKETIKDLGKLNPDWVIDKILDKTGIETRYILDEGENEKTLVTDACKKLFEKVKLGKIKVKIFKKYKLEDAIQAHKDLEARKIIGPAVIIP